MANKALNVQKILWILRLTSSLLISYAGLVYTYIGKILGSLRKAKLLQAHRSNKVKI